MNDVIMETQESFHGTQENLHLLLPSTIQDFLIESRSKAGWERERKEKETHGRKKKSLQFAHHHSLPSLPNYYFLHLPMHCSVSPWTDDSSFFTQWSGDLPHPCPHACILAFRAFTCFVNRHPLWMWCPWVAKFPLTRSLIFTLIKTTCFQD